MPWKFKTESTEPAREPGGCCGDAIGTAENIAELGTESLEGARKAVRARPLTTPAAALGVGAIIASLFMR